MAENRQDRVIRLFRAGKPAFDAKVSGDYYGYPPSPYESKNQRLNRGRAGLAEVGTMRLSTDGTSIVSYETWTLISRDENGVLTFGEKMYERPYGPTTKRHMELVWDAFKSEATDNGVPESVYRRLASEMETYARHSEIASVIRRKLLRDAPLFHTVDWTRVAVAALEYAKTRKAGELAERRISKACDLLIKAEADNEAWRAFYRGMHAA